MLNMLSKWNCTDSYKYTIVIFWWVGINSSNHVHLTQDSISQMYGSVAILNAVGYLT